MRHGPVLHSRSLRDRYVHGGGEDASDPGRTEGEVALLEELPAQVGAIRLPDDPVQAAATLAA